VSLSHSKPCSGVYEQQCTVICPDSCSVFSVSLSCPPWLSKVFMSIDYVDITQLLQPPTTIPHQLDILIVNPLASRPTPFAAPLLKSAQRNFNRPPRPRRFPHLLPHLPPRLFVMPELIPAPIQRLVDLRTWMQVPYVPAEDKTAWDRR